MKKIYLFAILLATCLSCTSLEKSDIHFLNGYWEIEKVKQPDAKEIDFGMNTIYDYYEVDATHKGFYVKASPQLDGTFIVDDFRDEIKVVEKSGKFFIEFHSEFDDREMTITELTADKLVLKNQEDKTYYYKKASPINLTATDHE
ncbi:MAG TPA: hypothetical protein VLZ11_08675 [Flavobacterium sp.]|nr:hypothetical protein [Flavobacterium sp.]